MKTTNQTIDYHAITARQRNTWATGDFHQISRLNAQMLQVASRRVTGSAPAVIENTYLLTMAERA